MGALAVSLAVAILPLTAQDSGSFGQPARGRQYVSYVAEAQTIAAKRPAELELRFHVNEGFHVNSHTPLSELQIPTSLQLQPASGAKVGEAAYPQGKPYKVGDDTLDVYTGDFLIRLPVTASAGDHVVEGELRYQACDRAACYPPRTLHVSVPFTAH